MSKAIILFLVAVFALSFSHAYITDITVDVNNGQIYVAAANILYELDNVAVTQNAEHFTPGDTEPGSLYVGKHNNKRVLFDYLSTDVGDNFVYYPVPLRNQDTLVSSQSLSIEKGLTVNSIYDQKDAKAIHSNGRNLTLVDLNSFTVLDTFQQWVGVRRFGRNIVYDHQNKHVYTFYTYVPYRGAYGLSVEEHSIATGTFVEVDTTYNCLCDDPYNTTASPFYKVIFAENCCSMDYHPHPPRIWCAYPEGKQLFSFNANNLTDFDIISTSANFDSVAWDFANRLVYAVYANGDDTDAVGFTVAKVHLANGAVVKTYVNTEINVDSTVIELDPNEPHLYLAVSVDTDVDSIVSLNTNNMATAKVVTLTPPSA